MTSTSAVASRSSISNPAPASCTPQGRRTLPRMIGCRRTTISYWSPTAAASPAMSIGRENVNRLPVRWSSRKVGA